MSMALMEMRLMINGMHALNAINLGVELGLFDQLAEEPVQESDFVRDAPYPDRYVSTWLKAVQAAGVLSTHESGTIVFNNDWRDALTNADSSNYVAELPRCHLAIARLYPRFPQLFSTGQSIAWPSLGRSFIEDISADGRRFANFFIEEVVGKIAGLRRKLESGCSVYDLGSGAGHFLVRLAQNFPSSDFVGVDIWDDAVAAGNDMANENGLENVTFRKENATGVKSDVADIVILNEVLHEVKPEDRLTVLKRAINALKPGGTLYFVDILKSDSSTSLLQSADDEARMVRIVDFFETPLGSEILTRQQLQMLFEQAGIVPVHVLEASDHVFAAYYQKP